jgi:hypothetical protein
VKGAAFGILAIALLLSSCSTAPVASSASADVRPDRQLLYRDAAPGPAPVTVMRDPGFYGAACATRVLVNDKLAAYVDAGEKVTLHIPEGRVILGAEPDGLCGGGRIELEARLQAGQRASFRIAKSMNGPGFYPTVDR